MKKLRGILSLFLIMSTMAIPVGIVAAGTEADPQVTDLIAGQYDDVGDVEIWNDATYLYVHYIVAKPGVYLTETHVHVGEDLDDFPLTKKGSPKIGKFDYSMDHNYETEYTEVILLADGPWLPPDILVAAHAVVSSMPLGMGPCPGLPSMAYVDLFYPNAPDSYFLTTISGGTSLDGTYDGWCIDADIQVTQFGFNAFVYCSYDPVLLTNGVVEHPENLDLVNWLLNQDALLETYPMIDIQAAIWTLIDDNIPAPVTGWTQANVDEIVAAAYAGGEGFEPRCGQYMAILLVPDTIAPTQATLIKIPRPCDYDETAWGDGEYFRNGPKRTNGKGDWSMYIEYPELLD